jgi:uncharacterized protein with von Willebrand factor type A (vWA) domain
MSRYLRDNGFRIDLTALEDLCQVLQLSFPTDKSAFKSICKTVLVKSYADEIRFSVLFDRFWKEIERAEDAKNKEVRSENFEQKKSKKNIPSTLELKKWLYAGRVTEEIELETYSGEESIKHKEFLLSDFSEGREIKNLIRQISKQLAETKSRRFVRTNKRKYVDVKSTIGESMKRNQQLVKIHYRAKKIRKARIVLLCDVSRSMDLYSRFLIYFLYGFYATSARIETFIFSTQIRRITKELRDNSYDKVLEQLQDAFPYWSSGTRIVESLEAFNDKQADRLLDRYSSLVILSDGWDNSDDADISFTMQQLRKKCHKIIWLNPLLSNPSYKPETKVMKAALPYIDVFSSIHDVASLRDLVGKL